LMIAFLLALIGLHRSFWLLGGTLALLLLTGRFYRRRFGGVTGDCLGATNQLVEALTLLLATHPHF